MGTFFSGGTIWCRAGVTVNALRIEGSKIVAVGEGAVARQGDDLVDLKGSFLAPAFADGHAHPLFAGREAQGPLVNGLQSVGEIVAEVKRFADQNLDMPWIIGGAYEAAIVERGDFLASWLDEAVSDRPVLLHAVDHHTVWVNSKAIEISGITSATVDPGGGTIARSEDGSARGTLREPAAIDLVLRHVPARTIESDVKAIAWASNEYLESGVTAASDAWIEPGMAEAYIEASKRGSLGIDISLFFLAQPESWRDRSNYFQGLRNEIEELGEGSRLTAKTIKIICDGALSSGTAALLDPYLDDPTTSGLLIWNDEELLDAAVHFDERGYQLHLHAIGDAAVRQALDVIQKVLRINAPWDRRPVIAHTQLIDPADLPRFAQLGVIANFQPLWMYLDPMNKELIAPRLGDERNNRQYQLASLVKTGARISFGSDWPVTSHLPLLALAVPTHRKDPDHKESTTWSPEESVSVEESLSFYTGGVAYQSFSEDMRGDIAIGMEADFIILSRSPLSIDPHDVSAIKIVSVYKAGKQVVS